MCESDLCPVSGGGVSDAVIYLRAIRVDTQQNALWPTTLTVYRPACIGAYGVIYVRPGVSWGQM